MMWLSLGSFHSWPVFLELLLKLLVQLLFLWNISYCFSASLYIPFLVLGNSWKKKKLLKVKLYLFFHISLLTAVFATLITNSFLLVSKTQHLLMIFISFFPYDKIYQ